MRSDLSSGTVLFVDDDPMVRECASALLAALGFEVIEAKDGLDALEKFQANPRAFAVVIMDITMPRLDGIEATKKIKAVDSAAKVILSSGGSHQAPCEVAHEGFLPKPYRGRELLETIMKVLSMDRIQVPWLVGI